MANHGSAFGWYNGRDVSGPPNDVKYINIHWFVNKLQFGIIDGQQIHTRNYFTRAYVKTNVSVGD